MSQGCSEHGVCGAGRELARRGVGLATSIDLGRDARHLCVVRPAGCVRRDAAAAGTTRRRPLAGERCRGLRRRRGPGGRDRHDRRRGRRRRRHHDIRYHPRARADDGRVRGVHGPFRRRSGRRADTRARQAAAPRRERNCGAGLSGPGRRGRGGDRPHGRLHEGARAVRQADRVVSGRAASGRRHAHRTVGRQACRAVGGVLDQPGPHGNAGDGRRTDARRRRQEGRVPRDARARVLSTLGGGADFAAKWLENDKNWEGSR